MDCTTAADLLLVAEPAALRGVGETELARHVRECARCREAAALILAEQARLANALTRVTAAHAPAVPRRAPRGWAAALLPLAAAAAIALIVWRGTAPGPGALPPLPLPYEPIAEMTIVNAPADRGVAVMRTPDPNITVVWYY